MLNQLPLNPSELSEDSFYRTLELVNQELARRKLIHYAKYVKSDFEANWHHELIAESLEKIYTGEITRLIITVPPRHGKTELTS
jgi:hypothetical protein